MCLDKCVSYNQPRYARDWNLNFLHEKADFCYIEPRDPPNFFKNPKSFPYLGVLIQMIPRWQK